MLNHGYSDILIGSIIRKDRSSIYRERKRNSDIKNQEYRYELAEKKADARKRSKSKYSPFTEEIKSEVKLLLEGDISHEKVKGLIKDKGKVTVPHETIYQYVWEDKLRGGDLHIHLRNNWRKYRERGAYNDSTGIIKNKQSVHQRPSIVDEKLRFEDIEIVLIIGMNHQQVIVTINDRVSGVLKMKKVKSKEAHEVWLVLNDLLEEWIPYIHTVTSNNGKKLAKHEEIAGI